MKGLFDNKVKKIKFDVRYKNKKLIWIMVVCWLQSYIYLFEAKNSVRLNLINHVLALFRNKFASNTTLRNPVFRWESCKGSV